MSKSGFKGTNMPECIKFIPETDASIIATAAEFAAVKQFEPHQLNLLLTRCKSAEAKEVVQQLSRLAVGENIQGPGTETAKCCLKWAQENLQTVRNRALKG